MKKIIIILSLLILILPMLAITVIDKNTEHQLEIKDFSKAMEDISTEKDKDGKLQIRNWRGIKLQKILSKYDITDFSSIRFTSADNYLVRLSKDDILNNDPLLAFYEGGEPLEGNNRLVSQQLSAMFWIQDIAIIATENTPSLSQPRVLYFAENILADMELITAPEPFIKTEGYYLRDVFAKIMPITDGEYQLVAKDGTSHYLDFTGFLQKAVLVKTYDGYNLQSPQMPGGMWIKNLAYIQKGEMAIIFRDQYQNFSAVTKLLNWHNKPQKLTLYTAEGKNIITDLPDFKDDLWKKSLKLVW